MKRYGSECGSSAYDLYTGSLTRISKAPQTIRGIPGALLKLKFFQFSLFENKKVSAIPVGNCCKLFSSLLRAGYICHYTVVAESDTGHRR